MVIQYLGIWCKINVKFPENYPPKNSIKSHQVHTDHESLSRELKSLRWDQMKDMTLEEAYLTFKPTLSEAEQKCSKRRKITTRKNLYMNRTAMQLRKRKRDLWAKYCQTQDVLDHARFVRCRNKLRKLTRNLRKENEIKLVSGIKQNPEAFWRYSSSRLKTKCRVEDLLDWKSVGGSEEPTTIFTH